MNAKNKYPYQDTPSCLELMGDKHPPIAHENKKYSIGKH